jgi:hypothetical protein
VYSRVPFLFLFNKPDIKGIPCNGFKDGKEVLAEGINIGEYFRELIMEWKEI